MGASCGCMTKKASSGYADNSRSNSTVITNKNGVIVGGSSTNDTTGPSSAALVHNFNSYKIL